MKAWRVKLVVNYCCYCCYIAESEIIRPAIAILRFSDSRKPAGAYGCFYSWNNMC